MLQNWMKINLLRVSEAKGLSTAEAAKGSTTGGSIESLQLIQNLSQSDMNALLKLN